MTPDELEERIIQGAFALLLVVAVVAIVAKCAGAY
jgi:hypothetical protein